MSSPQGRTSCLPHLGGDQVRQERWGTEIRELRKQIAATKDDDERARLSKRLAEAKRRYRLIDRPDAEAPWETDIMLPGHPNRIP